MKNNIFISQTNFKLQISIKKFTRIKIKFLTLWSNIKNELRKIILMKKYLFIIERNSYFLYLIN